MMMSTLISRVANWFAYVHSVEEPTTSNVSESFNEDPDLLTDDSDYHTLPGSVLSIDGQYEKNSEDPLKDSEVIGQNESEKNDYSVSSAQWTPEWPSDLEEKLKDIKCPDRDPSVKSLIGQNESENDYSLSSAQWTPEWPSDLEEQIKDIKCPDIDPSVKSSSDPSKLNKRTSKRLVDLSETSSISESSDSDANSKSNIKDFVGSRSKKVIKLSSDWTEDWRREWSDSNRNSIQSMVNKTDWAKCSSVGVNGGWKDGQWIIVYDNQNYIRTQVYPELLKRRNMNSRQGIGFQKQRLYNFM